MLSKSKRVIDHIKSLTTEEAFKAFIKAVIIGDFDLANNILMALNKEDRKRVIQYQRLYMERAEKHQACLFSKAFLAVAFYNMTMCNILGYPIKGEELDFAEAVKKGLKEQQELKERIEKIDSETGEVLKLDEYEEAGKGLEPFFDTWMYTSLYLISKWKNESIPVNLRKDTQRVREWYETQLIKNRTGVTNNKRGDEDGRKT